MKVIKKNNNLNPKKLIKKTSKTKKPRQGNVCSTSDQSSALKNKNSPNQNNLCKSLDRESTINSERIAKIKRAVERGEYKVDCTRTAEKLLQFEEEIWGKNGKI